MGKERLDLVLIQRELAKNRDEARRLIRAGAVLVNENRIEKPGAQIDEAADIRVTQRETTFASRGGLKLEEAINRFQLSVAGLVAADLGASTGGFTDCLIRHGIKKVFAIDVGYGQLAYHLRTDERVVVMDRTNCRHLTCEDLGEAVDVVVADLSFISMKTVFPAIVRIVKPDGFAIVLIKPQFEIGKGRIGKKGIVRHFQDHLDVLVDMYRFFQANGWSLQHAAPSPIAGKSGNIEFLFHVAPLQVGESVNSDTMNPAKSSEESNVEILQSDRLVPDPMETVYLREVAQEAHQMVVKHSD